MSTKKAETAIAATKARTQAGANKKETPADLPNASGAETKKEPEQKHEPQKPAEKEKVVKEKAAKAEEKAPEDPKHAAAKKVADSVGFKTIYENDKGEYFTRKDYGLGSVNGDEKRLTEHSF